MLLYMFTNKVLNRYSCVIKKERGLSLNMFIYCYIVGLLIVIHHVPNYGHTSFSQILCKMIAKAANIYAN